MAVQRHLLAALSPGKRYGSFCTGGCVRPRDGLERCGKSIPNRDSIAGPSSCSESLYRLSYPCAFPCIISTYLHLINTLSVQHGFVLHSSTEIRGHRFLHTSIPTSSHSEIATARRHTELTLEILRVPAVFNIGLAFFSSLYMKWDPYTDNVSDKG